MGNLPTSSVDHHNLDDLPDLIYHYVLKNLDLDDLWNLRLVSKRLYGIVRSHNIYELSITLNSLFRTHTWYSTIKPPKLGNQVDTSKIHLLLNPTSNLLNLKYLSISRFDLSSSRLDVLNKFTKLQILEIENLELYSKNLLKLPDLKALAIEFMPNDSEGKDTNLVIDTPNLNNLLFMSFYDYDILNDTVKFKHPQSIKHLVLTRHVNNAPIFSNLESLGIPVDCLNDIKADDLIKFNNLKKLILPKFDEYDSAENKLKDIFRSKKNDLELVLGGVKIKEINKIDECINTDSDFQFQLNNYDNLVDYINFFLEIDYNYLEPLLPDLPADLFSRYSNIQRIEIKSVIEDENKLILFIRGCSTLYDLKIERSSLNQHFYDQLSASSLTHLEINCEDDLILNFEFIMKMPYLTYLKTNQDILMSEQLNLNNFKYLFYFTFKINNQEIQIKKDSKHSGHRYFIPNYESLDLKNHKFPIDHNKLIKTCDWLRNKSKIKRSND